MSHHYSGPDYGFPMGTPAPTLLTCMPSQAWDVAKSTLIMNVHHPRV